MNRFIKRIISTIRSSIVIGVLAGKVSIALASLTFTGTTITGGSNVSIDAMGTSTATSITNGNSSSTVSFPGSVSIGTTLLPKEMASVRIANEYPGASIVEKIQAAITDLGGAGEVSIEPGTYVASAVSTWQTGVGAATKAGVLIPSDVTIACTGGGASSITYTRSGSDPVAALFVGTGSNSGIRITGCRISVTETSVSNQSTYAAPIYLHTCDRCEVDHNVIQGNSNRHDNWFLVNSTAFAYGDSAIGLNRGSASSTYYDVFAAKIHDNEFIEIGPNNTFSLLLVAQGGVDIYNNTFDLYHYRAITTTGNALEAGLDATGEFGLNVTIRGNMFLGGAGVYPLALVAGDVRGNKFYHSGLGLTAAGGSVSTINYSVNVSDNDFRYSSIRCTNQKGDSGYRHVVLANNRFWDGQMVVEGAASHTVSDTTVINNTIWNAPDTAIECTRCSVVSGNTIINPGQTDYTSVTNVGISINGDTRAVTYNTVSEDQNTYNDGTVCSVVNSSSSTCLVSGRSDWVYVTGGTWSASWTNRTLYISGRNQLIRGFSDTSHLQIETAALIPSGTSYNLHRTTYQGMQITAAVDSLIGNQFLNRGSGWNSNAMVGGGDSVNKYAGNYASTGGCSNCVADYFTDKFKGITSAHVLGTSKATIASGFGSNPTIAGTDLGGRVTVGTGGTATTGQINFGTAWTTAPACTANDETTVLPVQAAAATATLILTSASPWTPGDKLTWVCIGY